MNQYTKSIILLLSTSLLTGTNLSASGEDFSPPPSTALVPVKPVSSALSREVKGLQVALPDGTTSKVLGAGEFVDGRGRGATVTISTTASAPDAVNGGALVAVITRDSAIDRVVPPGVAPTTATTVPTISPAEERALYNAYRGVFDQKMTIIRVTPSPKYRDGLMRLNMKEPGLEEVSNALNSFSNEDIRNALYGLAALITRKQATYGVSDENNALRQLPPVINKVLAFLDSDDLGEKLKGEIGSVSPILGKLVGTCEGYMRAEGMAVREEPALDEVIVEGISISGYLEAALQLERALHTIGKPSFLQDQKENIRELARVAKEPFKGKLNKYLARLDAASRSFTSQTHADFNELEKGVIAINGLLEALIAYMQPAHYIKLAEMGRAKGIMDYKSTPLMLTDKASSSSSTALVALQRTKTEVGPVTDVARLRTLNATAGLARGMIPEVTESLRHQIERSNAYLGMAALTDGVTGEGSVGGTGGGSGVSSDAVVVVKK